MSIAYGEEMVIQALDLEVRRGEMVALLGPSGSGKSTLIAALAGFLPIASGEIRIDGRTVAGVGRNEPPERRGVAVVFQGYALWPHLSALETVAYPIRRSGVASSEARRRAGEILEQLGISALADRRPAELSGGEQQRVGLGRALAREAGLYLFDEPTAHLDTALRDHLQAEIAEQRRRSGAAAIYATHDTAEALGLADRVVLLRGGRIIQDGTPSAVYERPINAWAAKLTGPAATIPVCVVDLLNGRGAVEIAGVRQQVAIGTAQPLTPGEAAAVVRPDWVQFGGDIPARLDAVAFRGTHTDYLTRTTAGQIGVRVPGPPTLHPGESVGLTIERLWIPARHAGERERESANL
ncbi:MAG: ABC transporter ATP-binding protein [Candidatus Limnocylindrales bacterium]